ncbi:MAG: M48 family metallopeptidase [Anaerolineae bacterium]|nr:M48 family metallopeptidase [Anaerolineae bacterium]
MTIKTVAGSHTVQYGTSPLTFELLYSSRKTLAVHVHPDGSLVVDAPHDTPLPQIEQAVLHRGAWVLKQQREFASYSALTLPPRQYVSGESYRYLGRQYRLKVIADPVERIVLSRGHLTISVHDTTDHQRVRHLLESWYLRRACAVFAERLAACFPRVEHLGISYPKLHVKPMKARWGSCTPSGAISLNLRLIQVAKPFIDYVILHELCHLKELNHSTAFYKLLGKVLPEWERLRAQLNAIEVVTI